MWLFILCGSAWSGPVQLDGDVARVAAIGRYAVVPLGPSETLVRVVDRMAGAGPAAKRVDTFLDRGEYRIDLIEPEDAEGPSTVEIHGFTELNEQPPRLIERRREDTSLADLQQRSYWVDIEGARTVAFEATGRHVADIRLWTDGSWLHDSAPTCDSVTPTPGQPLHRCRLLTRVESGLYLLTVYGGPDMPWAEQGDQTPLHLQWGLPSLPRDAGRQAFEIGPTGIDRFVLPGGATDLRVELPEVIDGFALRTAPGTWEAPFPSGGQRTAMTDEQRLPVLTLQTDLQDRIVTVSGPPGQRYVLQHRRTDLTRLRGNGSYFVTGLVDGDPRDQVDPTAILTRTTSRGRQVVGPTQAIVLAGDSRYSKRFNLLETTELFVQVDKRDSFGFSTEGVATGIRVQPVLVNPPKNYRIPPYAPEVNETLDPGLYKVSLDPQGDTGIVTLHIAPRGWTRWALGQLGAAPPATSGRPAVQWTNIALDAGAPMDIHSNLLLGWVQRELPIDPTMALPLTLMPAETLDVPIAVEDRGQLTARTESGDVVFSYVIDPGRHDVPITWAGESPVRMSLHFVREALLPETPLPAMPAEWLAQLPELPVLDDSSPQPLDLDRQRASDWQVTVTEPGLYRLASTGLLATEGNLRTRVQTNFASAAQNGVGRNFLVARYLREGDYRMTVRTLGATRGHLGLTLDHGKVLDGGRLQHRVPGRTHLGNDQAIAYTFTVDAEDDWRITAYGPGDHHDCRLEDLDGWPVGDPTRTCDFTERLGPGDYRVLVLPRQHPGPVMTQVARTREAPLAEGVLPIGGKVEAMWRQKDTPDAWALSMPAPVTATFFLSPEMYGEVFAADDTVPVARLTPGKTWTGPLDRGDYTVKVRAARVDDRVPYSLSVETREVVAGTTRQVRSRASVPISIGTDGVVEITTFGPVDVRGRLLDVHGTLVAVNDDRPAGWNVRFAERLAAGRYTLELDPVVKHGMTEVQVRAPEPVNDAPLAVGHFRKLQAQGKLHLIPVTGFDGGVLAARVRSSENVEVAIEARLDGQWTLLDAANGTDATAMVRATHADAWRLMVTSLDHRDHTLKVSVSQPRSRRVSEGGGLFEISGPLDDVRVCDQADGACVIADQRLVGAGPAGLVVVGGTARRQTLTMGETRVVRVRPGNPVEADLPAGAGPIAVLAQAPGGQPGVELVGIDSLDMAPGKAIAVDPTGTASRISVWTSGVAVDARLRAVSFPPLASEAVPFGLHDGHLAPGEAARLTLPGTDRDVALTLDAGLVAVVHRGDHHTTHWADAAPRDEEVRHAGSWVAVFNVGDADAVYALNVRPSRDADHDYLASAHPFEALARAASTRRLAVMPSAGTIRLVGDIDATYLRDDGQVLRGTDLPAGPGGTLVLDHGVGPVLAWVDDPTTPEAHTPTSWPLTTVTGPRWVPVSGPGQRIDVQVPGPAVVHLRGAAPLVVTTRPAAGPSRTEVLTAGGTLDLPLASGTGQLAVRPLRGDALHGALEVLVSQPVVVGEGLGPEVLVAPGTTRMFRFELSTSRTVGIGVQASADHVEATLLSPDGVVHGSGLVQMVDLPAGTWLLALRLPEDAAPVRARPALAGIEAPDTGPPADVVQTYLSKVVP